MPSNPCPVCASPKFTFGPKDHLNDRPTASVIKFKESRNTGCPDCAAILDAIEEYDGGWVESHTGDGRIQLFLYNYVLNVYLEPDKEMRLRGKIGHFTLFQALGMRFSYFWHFLNNISYISLS